MNRAIRIHLVNGGVVESDSRGGGDDLASEQRKEIADLKEFLSTMLKEPPSEGWSIHFDLPGGGWAIFPRSSVLWIELVGFGGDND